MALADDGHQGADRHAARASSASIVKKWTAARRDDQPRQDSRDHAASSTACRSRSCTLGGLRPDSRARRDRRDLRRERAAEGDLLREGDRPARRRRRLRPRDRRARQCARRPLGAMERPRLRGEVRRPSTASCGTRGSQAARRDSSRTSRWRDARSDAVRGDRHQSMAEIAPAPRGATASATTRSSTTRPTASRSAK